MFRYLNHYSHHRSLYNPDWYTLFKFKVITFYKLFGPNEYHLPIENSNLAKICVCTHNYICKLFPASFTKQQMNLPPKIDFKCETKPFWNSSICCELHFYHSTEHLYIPKRQTTPMENARSIQYMVSNDEPSSININTQSFKKNIYLRVRPQRTVKRLTRTNWLMKWTI